MQTWTGARTCAPQGPDGLIFNCWPVGRQGILQISATKITVNFLLFKTSKYKNMEAYCSLSYISNHFLYCPLFFYSQRNKELAKSINRGKASLYRLFWRYCHMTNGEGVEKTFLPWPSLIKICLKKESESSSVLV